MERHRQFKIIALLVGVFSFVFAAQAQAVTLTYAADSQHGQYHYDYLLERAQEFKEATGIDVEITWSNHRAKIPVWAASGSMPDVVDIVSDYAIQYVDLYEDLRPYFEQDDEIKLSAFAPLTINAFTIPSNYSRNAGVLLALPYSFFSVIGGINKPLLNNAGLASPNTLGSQWTWDTLAEYTQKLTSDPSGSGNYAQYGLQLPFNIFRLHALFRQAGNPLYNRDFDPDQVTANTPGARATIRFLTDLINRGGVTTTSLNQAKLPFASGIVAITYDAGPNFAQQVLGANAGMDIDVIPYAYGPAGLRSVEATCLGVAVSRDSKLKDIAWQWLKFAFVEPEGLTRYLEITGRPPAINSLARFFVTNVGGRLEHAHIIMEAPGYPGSGVRPILRDTNVSSLIQTILNDGILKQKYSVEEMIYNIQNQGNALLADAFK
jgi:multiple sugar transport system substrate-binding protein